MHIDADAEAVTTKRASAGWRLSDRKLHSSGVQIVVLYVEADESIKRQLLRARQASLHNRCYLYPTLYSSQRGVRLLQTSDAKQTAL